MLAKEILKDVKIKKKSGNLDIEINKLKYDSRKVEKGDLFFCIKGENFDGHDFAQKAVENGAVGLVAERELEADSQFQVVVLNSRKAMAKAAVRFYNFPSEKIKLAGITGTNGKTTTTFMIDSILKKSGKVSGLIGTVLYRIGDKVLPVIRTTPEAIDLQRVFYEMNKKGVSHAAMEVSSHALKQHRIDGTKLEVLVFTNISQDHLDYHQTMEDYVRSKFKLFLERMNIPWVVNIDDEYGENLYNAGSKSGANVVTVGIDKDADIRARNIRISVDITDFEVTLNDSSFKIDLPLRGRFNVYNALCAIGAARIFNISIDDIKEGLESCPQIPGRFEVVDRGQNFLVIVDYAHTPDSLEKLLKSARELVGKEGRVLSVFGCGGDRDKSKRPKMGKIGASNSDHCIITTDNPRTEDPLEIIYQAVEGIPLYCKDKVEVEEDRRTAIKKAVNKARKNDIVVIAGKGHEDYQIFKDRTIHFDDREEAGITIEELLGRNGKG